MTATSAYDQAAGAVGEVILQAENVTMRFGGLTAVDSVSFTVHRGEIMGLIGPNGAGKTTFFNCLTGMYLPTSGRVVFDGAVLPPKPRKVVLAGMARTFQNIRLFGNMTALENVMVGRYCRTSTGPFTSIIRGPKFKRDEAGGPRSGRRSCSTSSASATRPTTWPATFRTGISDGWRSPGRWPPTRSCILLDEPTAGMNPQETRQAEELIFRIRDLGLAVVVIEHDMRFIFNLCDRVLCLVQGKRLIEGTPAEVQSDPRVIEAYIGTGPDDSAERIGAEAHRPTAASGRP